MRSDSYASFIGRLPLCMLEDGQRNELHMRKAMIAVEVLDSEALDFL